MEKEYKAIRMYYWPIGNKQDFKKASFWQVTKKVGPMLLEAIVWVLLVYVIIN